MSARILIVEDELIVMEDLRRKLRGLHYDVVGTAGSGEEAIRLARNLKPDLVLMDIRLRGPMDGTEAAKWIKELVGSPVIYLTAYAGVFVRDPKEMQPPGICLSKPFVLADLKAAIDVVLSPNT